MNADFLVSFPGLGIHDLAIRRVAFQFHLFGREISVYWYGVLIAAAMLLCLLLVMRNAPRYGLGRDDTADIFLTLIPCSIIGARLYYVAFDWETYRHNWRLIFDTRSGGLAFYGGVIGAMLGLWLVAAVKRVRVYQIYDLLAVYLPLGHAIGRWGNFFNQEAFGCNTDLPWGMISNGTASYLNAINPGPTPLPGLDPALPVHPTFLYEFLGNILIFILLLIVRKYVKQPLTVTSLYVGLYGIMRFFVEGIRTDPLTVKSGTIRVSQWLSAAMVVIAFIFIVINLVRQKKRNEALRGMKVDRDDLLLVVRPREA